MKSDSSLIILSTNICQPKLHCNQLNSLKSELGIALEAVYPDPGALRLEARTKFLARLMDATDVALSKHEQILIPSESRLGRIKANIPTCVACDRPLRSKQRQDFKTSNSSEDVNNHNTNCLSSIGKNYDRGTLH